MYFNTQTLVIVLLRIGVVMLFSQQKHRIHSIWKLILNNVLKLDGWTLHKVENLSFLVYLPTEHYPALIIHHHALMLSCEGLWVNYTFKVGLNNYSKYHRNHNIAECLSIFKKMPCFLITGKNHCGDIEMPQPTDHTPQAWGKIPFSVQSQAKTIILFFEKRNAKLPFPLKFPYSLLLSNNPLKLLTFEEQNGKHDSQPEPSTCRSGEIQISYSLTWMTMSL